MRPEYTDREIEMINTLLHNMTKVNSMPNRISEDIEETTIVQIGNNAEEKLFLLNALLDEMIEESELLPNTSAVSENVTNLTRSLKRILKDKEFVFSIKVPRLPGVEIPCSTLFEAKRVASKLIYEADVIYNNQVIL